MRAEWRQAQREETTGGKLDLTIEIPEIKIADRLYRPHAVVRQTRAALNGAVPDRWALDQMLKGFLVGACRAALWMKRWRWEQEEEQRWREEEKRQSEARERQRRKEEARRKALEDQARR